jgi:AcrR family transcriptional regulator
MMNDVDPAMTDRAETGGADAAPMGLRSRKKARQRSELLDAAAELFRLNGYERTRMEDIAAQAQVSTKTVYNYFATKRDVLFGFLNRDRTDMAAAYEAVLERPPSDPADALAELMQADIGPVASVEEKTLWREVMIAAARAHQGPDDDFERNRRMFTACIERLLAQFQAKAQLSPHLDIRLAADIVHTLHTENFRRFCALEPLTARDVFALAQRQMRQIVDGWR